MMHAGPSEVTLPSACRQPDRLTTVAPSAASPTPGSGVDSHDADRTRSAAVPGTILLSMAVLLSSCQSDPFAHRFLKKEPALDEAVGTYLLTEAYVSMIEAGLDEKIRSHEPTPSIELRDDGTAILRDFPLFHEQANAFDYDWVGFRTLEARWAIIPVGAVSSSVNDTAVPVFGLRLTDAEEPLDSPTFTGKETIDGMIFTFYDGDQGQILGFKKHH